MNKTVRIATRASRLALAQTGMVAQWLKEANPNYAFEIIQVKTTGDKVTDRPLSQFRGIGVFVKELENLLISGDADIAVHSLKDVPSMIPEELQLAAFPKREDPLDLLLTKGGLTYHTLPELAKIGTSSPRRLVQLKAMRPDFQFLDLRGNLDTRLAKLEHGQYDGIVAAAAGMRRLGVSFENSSVLPASVCVPAVGQGALVLECRGDDAGSFKLSRSINDAQTEKAVLAERSFMREMGAGCSAPIAALARVIDGELRIEALAGDLKSGKTCRSVLSDNEDTHGAIGKRMAEIIQRLCEENGIRI
jgi:hydroxymethylbilane synthase